MRVDLPAPFAPTILTIKPSSTCSVTSCRALKAEYWTLRFSTLSSVFLLPQISVEDRWVLRDLLGSTLGDQGAEVQHDDAVRETHDDLHDVLHHQKGHPPLVQFPHQR